MPDPAAFPRAAVPHRPDEDPAQVRPPATFSCRELCHLSETMTMQGSAIAEHLLDRSVT